MGLFGRWVSAKLCLVTLNGFDPLSVYAVDLSDQTSARGDFLDVGSNDVQGVFRLEDGMRIRIEGDGGGNFKRGFWGDGEIEFKLERDERYVDVDGKAFKVEGIHPNFTDDRSLMENWVRMFEDEVPVEVWSGDFEAL